MLHSQMALKIVRRFLISHLDGAESNEEIGFVMNYRV
jgi:hypothetical protein